MTPGRIIIKWLLLELVNDCPSYTCCWMVTFGGGRPETSEHVSLFCVEKSFWAGGLAPHRGHGYALEEYAIRRRRRMTVCGQVNH